MDGWTDGWIGRLRPSLQVNPHKKVRGLYGQRMMAQYRGVPLGELSPHVYAIAEQVRAWGSGGLARRAATRPAARHTRA